MAERTNNIAKFVNYIALLDAVYAAAAKTAILDTPETLVQLNKAGEFKVPKMEMDGLADYDRKTGYEVGTVTLDFETKKPDYDRARKFRVEEMDNEESAGVAFGSLSSEFIRTKAAPELDAYRFAKYVAAAGKIETGSFTTGTAVLDKLNEVSSSLTDAEVPEEGRVLFITAGLYNKASTVDTNKDKSVLGQFSQVVQVPSARFYSAIDLLDGKSTGEEAGGYKKAADAKPVNFLVLPKAAVIQAAKHRVNKVISPAENQDGDFWDFFYRMYAIAETYDNKKKGIYANLAE